MSSIGDFDPSNLQVAVETISQAFFDDPMYVHIEPDERKRMRVLKAQMNMAVKMFLRAFHTRRERSCCVACAWKYQSFANGNAAIWRACRTISIGF